MKPSTRWLQLTAAVICMVAVSNLQYGWTLFVEPLRLHLGCSRAEVQIAFTIFILLETWLVPLEVYLADRYSPALIVALGGLLAGAAWVLNSRADSLLALYIANGLGGVGAGMVYGTSMGTALKWFPDRRGLAAGLTAAGWGTGSALTVEPMRQMIEQQGFQETFLWFGIGQGAITLLMALLIRQAPGIEVRVTSSDSPTHLVSRSYTPGEMLRQPLFWLLYVMLTMVASGGLMATAQLAPLAQDLGVADAQLSLIGYETTALSLALRLDRILNGLTRPFFGWISDVIGREKTMLIAFGLEGLAILLLICFAHVPLMFVILTGLTYFAWGEAFSLFPALLTDVFGRRFASTNYGLLYTAKGTAALLVPLGNHLHDATGSWMPVFGVALAFDWTAALLAWFAVRPLRARLTNKLPRDYPTHKS